MVKLHWNCWNVFQRWFVENSMEMKAVQCCLFFTWHRATMNMMTSSMKTFPRYWPFVRRIHRTPVNSSHEGQWCGALMVLPEASFDLRVLSLPAYVCVCDCLSVCQSLVPAITRDSFKLGSTNLDYRCKCPWLRSLLFSGVTDLDLQGQI